MKLSEIQNNVEGILNRNRPHEALEFAQKLERAIANTDIKTSNPEAYQEITQLIFALYVFAIPVATDEIVESILRMNVLEALQLDFDEDRHLFERLDIRYNIYTKDEKQNHLSQLITYLKQNEQYLGNNSLPITDEQRDPTVKNWLEYYDQEAGLEGHSAFERAEFISSDPIANELSKSNKELLRKVCKLYDFLQGEVEEQNVYEVSSESEDESSSEEEPPHFEEEQSEEEASVTDQVETTDTVNLQNMPSPQEKSSGGTIDLRDIANRIKEDDN